MPLTILVWVGVGCATKSLRWVSINFISFPQRWQHCILKIHFINSSLVSRFLIATGFLGSNGPQLISSALS